MNARLRRLLTFCFMAVLVSKPVLAGSLSEGFLSFSLPPTQDFAHATSKGMTVPMWVIAFYIFYLGTIWPFNIAMLLAEPTLSLQRRSFAKHFCRANIYLASGDTAMFIAFLMAYLFPDIFATPQGSQKLMQLLLFGVFSTSITMSVYYFYIAKYYQVRFAAETWNVFMILILTFFIIRLLLHYNPENIWFSAMLPPGQPNYSAWLRNLPLFIYGLLAIVLVTIGCLRSLNEENKRINQCVIVAMGALVVSFGLYALDVFYSHKISRDLIYVVYALKTLAYMVAFIFMWLGEFYFGSQRRARHENMVGPIRQAA